MKKIFLVVLFLCITFTLYAAEKSPFPDNKPTVFEYSEDNIPDVCFFPVSEARWNGPIITTKEWRMLTDYQKTMFISEYVEELEKKNNEYIDLEDGWKFLIAVNVFVDEYGNNSPVLMTRVLDELLKE